MRINNYNEYLRNKRVIIVGPANSLIGQKQGEFIDSFDVIIRPNNGWDLPAHLKVDYGTRTDVAFFRFGPNIPKLKIPTIMTDQTTVDRCVKSRIKWIVAYKGYKGRINKFKTMNRHRLRLYEVPQQVDKEITIKAPKIPMTGVATIFETLRHPVKELYITGMTFMQTGYFVGYSGGTEESNKHISPERISSISLHDVEAQRKAVRELFLRDKRLKCDDLLAKILELG